MAPSPLFFDPRGFVPEGLASVKRSDELPGFLSVLLVGPLFPFYHIGPNIGPFFFYTLPCDRPSEDIISLKLVQTPVLLFTPRFRPLKNFPSMVPVPL